MRVSRIVLFLGMALAAMSASAQAPISIPTAATPQPGQVLAAGTVPDEASKAAVLARLRELYGADKVVDQIAVGQVVLPANWNAYVQKLLSPNLKQISRGQLKIDGSVVSVRGEVANEAQRQKSPAISPPASIPPTASTMACACRPANRACSTPPWPTAPSSLKAARPP